MVRQILSSLQTPWAAGPLHDAEARAETGEPRPGGDGGEDPDPRPGRRGGRHGGVQPGQAGAAARLHQTGCQTAPTSQKGSGIFEYK